MRYVRSNDLADAGGPPPGPPDLSPALGEWFNCNARTGEIARLSLAEEAGGLALRAAGASDSGEIDWGTTPALPHASAIGSREVTGFTARYDFGFMETEIAANLKYGVLVIQSYNRFRDGSGRPPYFTREFFHQVLGPGRPPAAPSGLPRRMAADLPAGPAPGAVDLGPLLGSWRNTYRSSRGVLGVRLSRGGEVFLVEASGVGCDEPWGAVPALPHATGVSRADPAGFLARYDFGFSEVVLSANEAKGLLIIASFTSFRDGSGRSGYFLREFFYREPNGGGRP